MPQGARPASAGCPLAAGGPGGVSSGGRASEERTRGDVSDTHQAISDVRVTTTPATAATFEAVAVVAVVAVVAAVAPGGGA